MPRLPALLLLAGLLMPGATFAQPDHGAVGQDPDLDTLPRDVIATYIRTKMSGIRACYTAGLKRRPDLAGKVKVAFLIQASGAVLGARVDHSTLDDAKVEACVLGNVKSWRFPSNPRGGSTKVTYPFAFSTAE